MKCMLSTFDNEYNPYDDFTKWYLRDCELGHNSSGHLAEITKLFEDRNENEYTDDEQELINEKAIDFIVLHDPLNIYRKVAAPQ